MSADARDLNIARREVEEALARYADLARKWNTPDDEHTRIQIRNLAEAAIDEEFSREETG